MIDDDANPGFIKRMLSERIAAQGRLTPDQIRATALGMAIQWSSGTKQSMGAAAVVKAAAEFEAYLKPQPKPQENDNG